MTGSGDFIERKVAQMLRDLRRSGFFQSGIEDARHLQAQHGYAWDVALAISCNYWCSYWMKEGGKA